MQIKLTYAYGRVCPELLLSEQEVYIFERYNIPKFISVGQMLVGLGELGINPRYVNSPMKCSIYIPMSNLTKEDLEGCAQYIAGEINRILSESIKPPLVISTETEMATQAQNFADKLILTYPMIDLDNQDKNEIHMRIADKVYKLQPIKIDTSDEYLAIKSEWANRFEAYKRSVDSQIKTLSAEYKRQIDILNEQLSRTVRLPVTLYGDDYTEDIRFFSNIRSSTGRIQYPYGYWFQLPFELNCHRIVIHDKLFRLKPEYIIRDSGYLTMYFNSKGQLNADYRYLTRDRELNDPMDHLHRLTGATFCNGSLIVKPLDFTTPLIPQVIQIRDSYEELLKTINPLSMGGPMRYELIELKSMIRNREWDRIIADDEPIEVSTAEESRDNRSRNIERTERSPIWTVEGDRN